MNKNKKKIAIIGKGKTGQKVVALAEKMHRSFTIMDSNTDFKNVPWDSFTGAIVFIPAHALEKNLSVFMQSKIPMVIGTTGLDFPTELNQKLLALKIGWVHGRNFALGMQLVQNIIQYLGKSSTLLPNLKISIHEIHHSKKLDAPSGTANAWKEWFGEKNIPITSERIGDVIGDHSLTLSTPFERITLQHQSLDRSIFAQGALWALDFLLQQADSNKLCGLLPFEEIVAMALGKEKDAL